MPSSNSKTDYVDGGSPPALPQPPRVATLFKLGDSVVRDGITLVLVQTFFQTANDLSGAPQCESYRVPKHFSLGHSLLEHIENMISSHYILREIHEGVTTARRQGVIKMCGRFTVKATWAELVALYRLTMDAPPHNLRPRYNVCPTDPVDVVTAEEGKRELITMRWGLIPRWWSKTIKDAKMATFNARAETIETKPFFRDAFKARAALSQCLGITSGKTR